MDYRELSTIAFATATQVALKILGALLLWVIGRMLIRLVARLLHRTLERQRVDPTLIRWTGSFVVATLNIVLVVGILGVFGIETTTLAALMAAAGVAIGMAWSGLLSNFAGGVFLVVLRPFHVGD